MQIPNFGCLSIINEMETNTFEFPRKLEPTVWQPNGARASHSHPMHFQIHKMRATNSFPLDGTSSRFQQTSSASRKIAFYYYLCRCRQAIGCWTRLNRSDGCTDAIQLLSSSRCQQTREIAVILFMCSCYVCSDAIIPELIFPCCVFHSHSLLASPTSFIRCQRMHEWK